MLIWKLRSAAVVPMPAKVLARVGCSSTV